MANPITPETRVHLLSVPLESNLKASLYFAGNDGKFSKSAQETYFLSRVVKSNIDFTYQRKDKSMVVPYLVDTIYSCNYVMYQNHNFTNKWFYAFITKMEYVDEDTTRLYIETDPIQTWYADLTFEECFVEREHAKVDTIGSNLLVEDLDLGEYICNEFWSDSNLQDKTIIISSSKAPVQSIPDTYGRTYNAIFSGLRYYRFDTETEAQDALNLLSPTPEAILGVFIAPKFIAPVDTGTHNVARSDDAWAYQLEDTKMYSLNGYSPHNNKLLTYPYCFYKVSNHQGQTAIYHQEFFNEPNIRFNVIGTLCPGCSIRIYPVSYNGATSSQEYGLNLGKYPVCCFQTDSYINWLTENGVSNAVSSITGLGALIGGISAVASGGLTLVGGGAILGGFGALTNSLRQRYVAEMQPPQVSGNTNCGDVMCSINDNTFHFYKMTIRYNQAVIIDKFFDMCGYKTNLVKKPFYNHRKNYWYTKTIDCNITGDIPEEDMERIKQCYNNGITFWKNPSNMYDYSVDNSII